MSHDETAAGRAAVVRSLVIEEIGGLSVNVAVMGVTAKPLSATAFVVLLTDGRSFEVEMHFGWWDQLDSRIRPHVRAQLLGLGGSPR